MGGFLPPAERRSSALLGLYAALSLFLLVAGDHLPTSSLRGVGAWMFAPLDRMVLSVDRMVAAWRESERLRLRVAELELENVRLRSAGVENRELRLQIGLPVWHGLPLKPIEILALSGEPIPVAAVLSAGREQGVGEGDVVMTQDGLLGRVSEVYPSLARAVLLTDPNSAVACEVESTGVMGVLHSVSVPRPRLTLTGIPLADTVRVGQQIVTSGLSSRYPRGIPVGTVTRIGRETSGLTQDIEIAPTARLARLRHGFIIIRPHTSESTP